MIKKRSKSTEVLGVDSSPYLHRETPLDISGRIMRKDHQQKGLFIIPTEHILRNHETLGPIMEQYHYLWHDLVMDVVTPFLDEISRGDVTILDTGIVDRTYAGEEIGRA